MTDNEKPPRLELVIRVEHDGRLQVTGPIHDRMTCYALLECARDAIKDSSDKARRSAIVQARPADPFLITKRRSGDANGG